MSGRRSLHYSPASGYLGDTIPFYWNGEYHLFYVRRPPFHPVDKLSIEHIVSRNLVDWEELPTAIPLGRRGEPDCDICGSGSVIEREGTFYFFYKGQDNESETFEKICVATSSDLIHWEKSPDNPILVPDHRWYARGRWADSKVFWNPEAQEFWMLITAQEKNAPKALNGCLGLAVSRDLQSWEVRPPCWSPHVQPSPECPDIFQLGDRWCLLTNWIHTGGTVYRLSDSPSGPWTIAGADNLDTYDNYALNTMSDGNRRIALGWVGGRTDALDSGTPTWGGHLCIPRELYLSGDDRLKVRYVPEWEGLFPELQPLEAGARWGDWDLWENGARGSRSDGAAYMLIGPSVEDQLLHCNLVIDSDVTSAGFLVHADKELSRFYSVRLEVGRKRVRLERQPPVWLEPWTYEQPFEVQPGRPVKFTISVADNILEVFVDDSIALTMRLYDYQRGYTGLFVEQGCARFENIQIKTASTG
ncbi:MAG: GH32 C-terminal domain-containing protein [Armatimonadetes bacterium]|nr:GH32 C-terminal domain-containing protein [Armatimonadota bacterium]